MAPPITETVQREGRSFVLERRRHGWLRVSTRLALRADPLAVPMAASVVFRVRTPSDDHGERLRMNRVFRTGDPAFDANVYVASDLPEQGLHRLTAPPALREALWALLWRAPGEIALSRDGQLSWQTLSPRGTPPSRDEEQQILDGLGAVASRVPPLRAAPRATRWFVGQPTWTLTRVAFGVSLVGMLCSLQIWRVFEARLTVLAAAAGLLAALASWPVYRAILRGTGDGWRWLKWCLLFSPLAGLTGGIGLARIINCAGDTQPATRHVVDVLETIRTQRRDSSVYSATVRSWRAPTERLSLGIDPKQTKERTLVVVTKPGRLGGEWLVAVESNTTPP